MNPPLNHLGALTGMRFFAAMVVVIFHLIVDTDGDGLGRFGLPSNNTPLGAAAVSFFFVLSGFILTYVYKDQLTLQGVKKFYYKRWARIWPLHLVCLVASIYVISIVITDYRMLAVNLALLQSWVPDSIWVFSFNGVSWSISCEMFFYLMFPIFLIGGQTRFWMKYALLWALVVGAVIGMQGLANHPDYSAYDFDRVAHVNPFLRLPEFCTGMGVGFLFFNRASIRKQRPVALDTLAELAALSLLPLFSLGYGFFKVTWLIRTASWGGGATALWFQVVGMMFVFAVVIYVFARSHGLVAQFLGSRPMIFLGEISFALYMIHFLVIIGIDRMDWSMTRASPWVLGSCAIGISLGLAAFLYILVEMPAKSGLMRLYSRDYKKATLAFPTAWLGALKSPAFWGFGLILAISLGGIKSSQRPVDATDQILAVVAASHAPYKDVNFGDQIRLFGVEAIPTAKGIELRMVWQKRGPLNRSRFLHFCDEEGNILTQLPPQKLLYQQASIDELVLEQCLIPNAKLEDNNITQIGIGFFSKEIDPLTDKPYGMLKVSKGLRGMSNFRLYVIGQNEMVNLRKRLESLAGEAASDSKPPPQNE